MRSSGGRVATIVLALAVVTTVAATSVVFLMHRAGPTAAGSRGSAPPARHQGTTPAAPTPQRASGRWTASRLVITPRSLGAVTLGMTLAQASAAAGVQIAEVGDGYGYPSVGSQTGLAIEGMPVGCVSASAVPGAPAVVTAQGFLLGGTVQALRSLYGSRVRFIPAPATGISPQPGYVVSLPSGNLAFIVHQGIVTTIMGGNTATPSTC